MISAMIPNQCLHCSEGLNRLRLQEMFCDLTIESSQGSMAVHSVLLASCNPTLCTRIGSLQTSTGMKTLYLPQYPLNVVRNLLQYIYTGVLEIHNFENDSLKRLSNEFEMFEVINIIQDVEQGLFVDKHGETSNTNFESKRLPETLDNFKICIKNAVFVNGKLYPLNNPSGCKQKVTDKKKQTNIQNTGDVSPAQSVPVRNDEEHQDVCVEQEGNEIYVCTLKENISVLGNTDNHVGNVDGIRCKNILDDDVLHEDVCDMDESWQELPRRDAENIEESKSGSMKLVNESSGVQQEQLSNSPHLGPPLSLVCPECKRIFRSECLKLTHMKTQHGIVVPEEAKDKLMKCKHPGCSYETLLQFRLQAHLKSHESASCYNCTDCGTSLKSRSSLLRHKKAVHSSKQISCDVCGKILKNLDVLKLHKKRVHEATQYLCSQCPYTTTDTNTLENHMHKKHGQPYSQTKDFFQCDHCKYKTRRKNSYTNHMRRHTGDFPFQCEECGKRFPCRSDLTFHAKWHKDKTHKCKYEGCQFAAVLPSKLQEHIRSQHTHKHVKPFICEVCGYQTNRRNNLILHIRNVHKLKVRTKQRRVVPTAEKTEENHDSKEDGIYVPGYEEAMEQYRKTTHTVSTINTNGLDEHCSVINHEEIVDTEINHVSDVLHETSVKMSESGSQVPSHFLKSSGDDLRKRDGTSDQVVSFADGMNANNSYTSLSVENGAKIVVVQKPNDIIATNFSNPKSGSLFDLKSSESENSVRIIFQDRLETVVTSNHSLKQNSVPVSICPPRIFYLNNCQNYKPTVGSQSSISSGTASGSDSTAAANLYQYIGQGHSQGQTVVLNSGVSNNVSETSTSNAVHAVSNSLSSQAFSTLAPFLSDGQILSEGGEVVPNQTRFGV